TLYPSTTLFRSVPERVGLVRQNCVRVRRNDGYLRLRGQVPIFPIHQYDSISIMAGNGPCVDELILAPTVAGQRLHPHDLEFIVSRFLGLDDSALDLKVALPSYE